MEADKEASLEGPTHDGGGGAGIRDGGSFVGYSVHVWGRGQRHI